MVDGSSAGPGIGRRDLGGLAGVASLGIAASVLPAAAAAVSGQQVAAGSDESSDGTLSDPFTFAGTTYRSRTYVESGRFVVTAAQLDVSLLIAGGGGGGGYGCGGGGGQVTTGSVSLAPGDYAVTVGLGGEGAAEYENGGAGGTSSFVAGGGTLYGAAGGGGGFSDEETQFQIYRGGASGAGIYPGGDVAFGPEFRFRGGGGGGAGGYGADGSENGAGGNSVFVSGFGPEVLSLGGGGGGWDSQGESPSSAGVGAGDGGFGPLGTANALGQPGGEGSGGGGGGGAGDYGVATGAAGGSGCVVVRYRVS